MNSGKHYAAGILAFAIWGFFPIALRMIQAYSAGEILYFRIFFSLLVLLIIIPTFRRKNISESIVFFKSLSMKQRKIAITLTLLGGVLLSVNWLTFIYIVNNINIKTASFSYLICPVITAILGYLLLRENLTRLQWLAVGLCALSCMLIGINSALELGYSILTAFSYALYLISQRKNQGFDRMIALGIQVLFSFIILSTLFTILVDTIPTSKSFYGIIVMIAVLFTVLPLFLNLFALNKINSATIGILMYLNPLINFTVAFLVFHETINAIQLFGYSVIAVALVLFNYPNFRKLHATVSQRLG